MGPCRTNKLNLEEFLPFQTLCVNLNTSNSFQEQPGILCDFRVFFSLYTISQTPNGDCRTHLWKVNRCWWLFGRKLNWTRQYRYLKIKTASFWPRFFVVLQGSNREVDYTSHLEFLECLKRERCIFSLFLVLLLTKMSM